LAQAAGQLVRQRFRPSAMAAQYARIYDG
jgi:hypothetical protein